MGTGQPRPVSLSTLAPSSSGPGQRVLSSRIVGSNPTGVTKLPFLER